MIVRIMGEGQLEVPDDALDELNRLDQQVVDAIDRDDEDSFRQALAALLDATRARGTKVPDDFLGSSDYALPPADATLGEVRSLLGEEGLIPD